MIRFTTFAAVATCTLMLSAGAFAEQPADGQQPYASTPASTPSTLQRSAVEADAARHPPADGEQNAKSAVAPAGQAATRAQVKQATQDAAKAKGGFPDASGMQNK